MKNSSNLIQLFLKHVYTLLFFFFTTIHEKFFTHTTLQIIDHEQKDLNFRSIFAIIWEILSKIPSFKIIFSRERVHEQCVRGGGIELPKAKIEIIIFSPSVAWFARIDISIVETKKKNFHEIGDGKRTVVTDRGRKKEEKREKGEKIRRRHLFPSGKVSCLRNDSRYAAAEHVNVFNCTPFVGYSRLFISRPGVQPWNCTAITACLDSRKNLSRVWARIGFSSLRSIA